MKITEIETITIQLPGRMDYSWRSLQVPIGRYVILKLITDEGIVGLGEAPAILSWAVNTAGISARIPRSSPIW